jgi:hypothetical protein
MKKKLVIGIFSFIRLMIFILISLGYIPRRLRRKIRQIIHQDTLSACGGEIHSD